MYLPPLQSIDNKEIRICGDVDIHPSASIAPGVILQAMPDSRIVIGADACIGMGTIVTANKGEVEISSGVTLGSGVLIVGKSKIGSNACIGTASTIVNFSVEPMRVVDPGSILGDRSRTFEDSVSSVRQEAPPEDEASCADPETSKPHINNEAKGESEPEKEQVAEEASSGLKVVEELGTKDPWEEVLSEKESKNVSEEVVSLAVKEVKSNLNLDENTTIGKVYIDQLLVTLFPHKKHNKT